MHPKLSAAIALAGKTAPYWRVPMSALTFVEEKRVPTMAVDPYWRCYYSPEFVESLPVHELAYVVLHELAHLLFRHSVRCKRILGNHKLWNVSADCEINGLVWDGLKLPAMGVTATKLDFDEGLSAEEYYRMLYKQAKEKLEQILDELEKDGLLSEHGSGVHGIPMEWDAPPPTKNKASPDAPKTGDKAKDGKRDTQDDKDAPEGQPDGKEGESKPIPGESPIPGGLSEVEASMMADRAADAIKKHLNSQQPGRVPAGLKLWADAINAKKELDWRRLLRAVLGRELRRTGLDARDWGRVKGRFGVFTPRRKSQQFSVAIVVDTSGSMGQGEGSALHRALTEVVNISKETSQCDVVWCDTVTSVQRNVKPKDTLKPVGGGGTDMGPGLEEAEKMRPDYMVLLTDGYMDWPQPPKTPNLCVVVGGYQAPAGWNALNVEVK